MRYLLPLASVVVLFSPTPPIYADSGRALVTSVQGETVTLSAGSSEGIAPGSMIDLVRMGRALVHPLTGELLETPTVRICGIIVDEVATHSSTGRAIHRVASPRIGDVAQFDTRPPLGPFPGPTASGNLPPASGSQTSPSLTDRPPTATQEQAGRALHRLPPDPYGAAASPSKSEQAQFVNALRATHEFARSSRDAESIRSISQRLLAAERTLAAHSRRLERLNSTGQTDVAQLRNDVVGVKEKISLLHRQVEDLRLSLSGTGGAIRSKGVEASPVQESSASLHGTTTVGRLSGAEGSPHGDGLLPTREKTAGGNVSNTVAASPRHSYLRWIAWTIGLTAAFGSSVLLILRRLRRRRPAEAGTVGEGSGLAEEAPSPAEEIISPRKKRRVDFSANEGDLGQPHQGQSTGSQN